MNYEGIYRHKAALFLCFIEEHVFFIFVALLFCERWSYDTANMITIGKQVYICMSYKKIAVILKLKTEIYAVMLKFPRVANSLLPLWGITAVYCLLRRFSWSSCKYIPVFLSYNHICSVIGPSQNKSATKNEEHVFSIKHRNNAALCR